MSNPQLIHRANENSSLYNTIKARNSKSNFLDYAVSGEKNICPVARSRLVVNATTSMNTTNAQQLKFELSNHGILEDMYLRTNFSQGDTNTANGNNDSALVEFAGAFAWSRVRIVYQGNTIWECTPEWVIASQYTRAGAERSKQLDAMLGAGILGAANDTPASITGRRLVSSCKGGVSLACPLKAFFADSLGRGFDLYSLSSRVYVEVDYRANSQVHSILDTASDGNLFENAELICYISELSSAELVAYQSRQYAPNSVSSQLGFTTTHFSEAIASPVVITGSSTTGNKVKIQSISGLVRRLYVFATLDSDRASATARAYMKLIDIASLKLGANNQTIYELENSAIFDAKAQDTSNGYNVDCVVEAYKNNLPMSFGVGQSGALDIATTNALAPIGSGDCDINKIKVINFAYSPDDYSSADGSLSFSQLSSPTIEVMFPTGTSGAHTLHIVAEVLTINTYNTSSTGQINFKMITE